MLQGSVERSRSCGEPGATHRSRLKCRPLLTRVTLLIAQSHLFRREPAWFDDRSCVYRGVPMPARSWLYEPGSLTLRLQRACGSQFCVRVLAQGWGRAFAGERRLLGLAAGELCLLREVVLARGDQPLVLARSIIPARTLRRADRSLARLGSRPLGEVLFACPRLRRARLQLARVGPGAFRSLAPEQSVWGRRSLYSIAAGDLLVCEFFLPAALALPEI